MSESQPPKRIFIGGLSASVSESELVERFSRFGKVSNVSLKTRIDDNGTPLKSFAHLDLQGDEASLRKCFSTYQKVKWKGSMMNLQYAKESVLERLQREREGSASTNLKNSAARAESPQPLEVVTAAKGVPGTPVPGKKDWVVGKYGRAVPIMKLKKSYKIPMVKHDPSKYCHTVKIFKDDTQDSSVGNSCDHLTWLINKPDSEITKKRKGEFPQNSIPLKKKAAPVGPKHHGIKEKNNTPSSFHDLHNGGKLSATDQPKDNEGLEIVKIGANFKNPRQNNLQSTSNKFDSDIDSDTESVPSTSNCERRQSSKSALGKFKKLESELKNPTGNSKGLSKSKSTGLVSTVSQPVSHMIVDSSNKLGRPEFKELSSMHSFGNISSANLNTEKLASVALNVTVVNDSQTEKSAVSTPANSKILTAKSVRESSVISKPVHDTTIASPAPFNDNRGMNKFQISTPYVPADCPTENHRQTVSQNQHFRVTPEFRGLGKLADYNFNDTKKEPSVHPYPSSDNTISRESRPSNHLLPSVASPGPSRSKDSVKSSSAVTCLSAALLSNSDQKLPRVPGDEANNDDSDSSTGTDEIILRHKEKKSAASSALPTASSSPKQQEVQPKVRNQLAADTNLILSEYVSSVTDFDETIQTKSDCEDSGDEEDAYDSDLDSNDFALVAKKLQQQVMLSKQGKSRNVITKSSEATDFTSVAKGDSKKGKVLDKQGMTEKGSKKGKVVEKQGMTEGDSKKGKIVDKQGMTDGDSKKGKVAEKQEMTELQTRLTGIAGIPVQSGAVPSLVMAENENRKHQKHEQLSEKEKHRAANEKRLEAVKQQARQRQKQQQLVQQALKSVDASESNSKRIVFESSEDDDDDGDGQNKNKDDKTKVTEKLHNVKAHDESQQIQEKPGPSLFASSDNESDEDDDYNEMFKSKPQFEGKKGEKLLKMENRFGDKRFKLDAKFADTDSEEEDVEEEKEKGVTERQEGLRNTDSDLSSKLKEEKSASLKVLENVIGKTTLDRFSEKISRNTKTIIDMNTVRFDPTKMSLTPAPETAAEKKNKLSSSAAKMKKQVSLSSVSEGLTVEKQATELDNIGKTKSTESEGRKKPQKEETAAQNEKSEKKDEEKLEKMTEASRNSKTSVELASALLDLFKTDAQQSENTEEVSFSLSRQFGEADSEEGDQGDEEQSLSKRPVLQFEKTKTIVKANYGKVNNGDENLSETERESRFGVGTNTVATAKTQALLESDLSSGEEDQDKEEEMDGPEFSATTGKNQTDVDEEMLSAGRTDVRFTKEQWLEQWDTLRQTIIKIYKKKHKDALKKKRIQGEQSRKTEFLKNSRKAGKKNWGSVKRR
ncbi:nucleolar protein 8 [Plakobranchus ocellatus]|uniref:Nucleolar protein 8 n=1 Tax=Plakobranchus ocellatus TaxID=259542 RepID=A0AAV4A8A2_9GAST|nr:nucleolar protein 8 [Plakobranchus ocellatus]